MADRGELTRRGLAATGRRDLAELEKLMHPDVELESRFSTVDNTIYVAIEGVRKWIEDLADVWEYVEIEFESLVEEGNDVTLVHATLHGRESGVQVDEPVVQRHHWRRERIIKIGYVGRSDRA